jgi:glycosyltransferase involved in cell wall biosynthesis
MSDLNGDFSTTRRAARHNGAPPALPPNAVRLGEGGLRNLGYGKRNLTNGQAGLPLISVITVVYNARGTIERAIQSVITQAYDNVEFIVLDGGSTDGTLDIIRRYEHAIDYWASEPDAGIYDAMNKAAGIATGDWVYFLNSDDLLVNCLDALAPRLVDSNTVYYGDVYMPQRHMLYGGRFTRYRLMFTNICHQAVFYPRSVFARHRYDTKYNVLADHAFNIAVRGDLAFRFTYLPILVCLYNDLSGHSFGATDAAFEADRASLIAKAFSPLMMLVFRIRFSAYQLKTWAARRFRRRAR